MRTRPGRQVEPCGHPSAGRARPRQLRPSISVPIRGLAHLDVEWDPGIDRERRRVGGGRWRRHFLGSGADARQYEAEGEHADERSTGGSAWRQTSLHGASVEVRERELRRPDSDPLAFVTDQDRQQVWARGRRRRGTRPAHLIPQDAHFLRSRPRLGDPSLVPQQLRLARKLGISARNDRFQVAPRRTGSLTCRSEPFRGRIRMCPGA